MAQVTLSVGGRSYQVACRDGGEARLHELAAIVDAKASEAMRAIGSANETRLLLFAALLVADMQTDVPADPAAEVRMLELADRIDGIAARLEELGKRP